MDPSAALGGARRGKLFLGVDEALARVFWWNVLRVAHPELRIKWKRHLSKLSKAEVSTTLTTGALQCRSAARATVAVGAEDG